MIYCIFFFRFIVHNDENNPTVSSLEAFSEEVKQFSPTLLVVGGLQMLDNFPFSPGIYVILDKKNYRRHAKLNLKN